MFPSSLPDTCSILDISPRSQASQQYFNFQSAITTSLDFEIHANLWQQKEAKYEISKVLLFKNIPEDLKEVEILTLCQPFGFIKDVFIKKQKGYAFVQFETLDQAQRCYDNFAKLSPTVRGHPLYVFRTGKDKITKPENCVGLPSRFLIFAFNNVGINIDSNFIYQLISPYGRCVKIIPLQTKNSQAFVEMEDVLQAIQVQESLDAQTVFGTLYVRVVHTEERDIFQRDSFQKEVFQKDFFQNTQSIPNAGLSTVGTLDHLVAQSYGPTSGTSLSNIWSEPKNTSCAWPSAIGLNKPASFTANPPVYRSETFLGPSPQYQQDMSYGAPKERAQKPMSMVNPLFHTKEEKSPTILLLKNLPLGVTARNLFRLFGMYGNVMKVKIFFKNPENALVEYQNTEQAELAKSHLNNCSVYGNNIFVTNSRQGVVIDTSSLKKGEETQYMGDYSASPEHRYKFSGSKNYLNIVPPSRVLHLSNLCDDKDEEFYVELFKDYGHIKKFTFLKGLEKMVLMEMSSIDEAVKILMNFHNFNINGKYLKVSFSKYQKIKDI